MESGGSRSPAAQPCLPTLPPRRIGMGRISSGYLNEISLQLLSLSHRKIHTCTKRNTFWKLLVILLPCCWGSPAGNSLQASLLLGAADSVCPQQSGFLLKLDTLKLLFHFGRYLYKSLLALPARGRAVAHPNQDWRT